jgi:hypothetical protein
VTVQLQAVAFNVYIDLSHGPDAAVVPLPPVPPVLPVIASIVVRRSGRAAACLLTGQTAVGGQLVDLERAAGGGGGGDGRSVFILLEGRTCSWLLLSLIARPCDSSHIYYYY